MEARAKREPRPAPNNNAGLLALEKIKALHLQIHVGVLAGMEIIRSIPGGNKQFEDFIAILNHWAGVCVVLSEAEQLLVSHLGEAPRKDLH
jgi:hypothetical protein